jgi:choice-of-anchor B domain-containing protein
MRACLIIFIIFLNQQLVYCQNSFHINLLSSWNNTNLSKVDGLGSIWNDITGWHDSIKKREYAIAGTGDSIYFFDITIPTQIKLVAVEDGKARGAINRDYETYSHYVYCVADQGYAALQVFDLQFLPDSVHKVFESDSLGMNTHSMHIESASKRLYMCSNKFGRPATFSSAMDILSLENPETPEFLGRLDVPKNINGQPVFNNVHEVFTRNDTAYCSAEYQGLFIYDLTNLSQQKLLGVITNYAQAGYNHTSWLDKTGKYIVVNDEVPTGLAAKIFDISDFRNPTLLSLFNSHPKATPHNCFWVNNYIYQSSYQDGVYIWNASDPKNPKVAAYYDTYPQNDTIFNPTYEGCWGVFPYLPSGNIIASDRANGIFVLKPDSTISNINIPIDENDYFHLYPNPVSRKLCLRYNGQIGKGFKAYIYSSQGQLINLELDKIFEEEIMDVSELSSGVYFIFIYNDQTFKTLKFIKL